MVGRTSLAAFAASALLFSGGGLAYADSDLPAADTSLIEVYVNSESDIDKLIAEDFDLAEYKRVEDDKIVINIDADAADIAALKAKGFGIGATIEDAKHRAAVAAERDEQREARRARAQPTPRTARPRASPPSTRPARPSSSARTSFTNYAGTFLYVEAHNKDIVRTAPNANTYDAGPTLAVSVKGATGDYGTATTMPRFIDTDPTPDEYLYNKVLIRLTRRAGHRPASSS